MIHPIAQAQFREGAVGTLVTKASTYLDILTDHVKDFDFPDKGDSAGQGFIPIEHAEVKNLVVPGVAHRTLLTDSTSIVRQHRGEQVLCIDRSKVDVGKVDGVAAIVYTIDAYLRDPEVSEDEKSHLKEGPYSHVLVTTLGFKGPKAPVGPGRFMKNIAGANNAYASTDSAIVEKAIEYLEASKNDPTFAPIEKTSAWAFCKWAGNQDIDSEVKDQAQDVLTYWSVWATVG